MNSCRHFAIIVLCSAMITPMFSSLSFAQEEELYYVYVDPLPSYADYASNVIADATSAWSEANPNIKFYQASTISEADVQIEWIKEYGEAVGEYLPGSRTILIALGDSNCLGDWQPFSSSYVTNIAMHEFGHFLGLGHSQDPDNIMYYIALGHQYGTVEIEKDLAADYWYFVPVCTINDVTSYSYQVTTTEPTYGFDVYFVSSISEAHAYENGQDLQYYSDTECFGKNYLSYGGICQGVSKTSGLLIIMPATLTHPIETITVKLEEGNAGTGSEPQQIFPQPTPTPTPFTPISPIAGFINVEQDQYIVSKYHAPTQANIYGHINDPKHGKVLMTLTKPDGTTEELQVHITNKGDFSLPILLDVNSVLGQYLIDASYQGSYLGVVSFTVLSEEQYPDTKTTKKQETTSKSTQKEIITQNVPDWVKNTAKWWSEEKISDSDFSTGIEFLIKEKIIKIPEAKKSGSETVQKIPGWIKNNAGWWASGKITDDDFVKGIEYLVKVGIIRIQ